MRCDEKSGDTLEESGILGIPYAFILTHFFAPTKKHVTMSAAETKKKELTLEEISKHNTQDSCWLIIGNLSNGAFQPLPLWRATLNSGLLSHRQVAMARNKASFR